MQLSGNLGPNTFYFSSSKFESGILVMIHLYSPDRSSFQELFFDEFIPGVYVLEHTFTFVGKHLTICFQNAQRVLLGSITIDLPSQGNGGVRIVIPGR